MPDQTLTSWRQECDAIEQEMDRLIRCPVPASAEERQVRRIQFAALVQRREDAARKLIQADRARFRNSWQKDSSAPGEHFISAPHTTLTGDAGSTSFVKLPDGRSTGETVDASPDSPAIDASGTADPGEKPTGAPVTQSNSTGSSRDPGNDAEPIAPADAEAPIDSR